MSESKKCKYCGFELEGEDIYIALKGSYPDKKPKELREMAKNYGWTKENKLRFSRELCCEDPAVADGSIYHKCPKCDKIVRKGTYWHRYVEAQKREGREVIDPEAD